MCFLPHVLFSLPVTPHRSPRSSATLPGNPFGDVDGGWSDPDDPGIVDLTWASVFFRALAIRRLKSSLWFADHPAASNPLLVTVFLSGTVITEPPPCVSSHTLNSRRSCILDLGFWESQLAFHRLTHSVCRLFMRSLAPSVGIPSSLNFFRSWLGFMRS